jgi:phosphatidylserine decarboxylase
VVNPPRPGHVRRWNYQSQKEPVDLPQGAELGRFLLGSTVIVLWPHGTLRFDGGWSPGAAVRMGQALGVARGA